MIYEIEYDRHEIYGDDIYIFYFNNEGQEIPLQLNLKDYYENDSQLLESPTRFDVGRQSPDFDVLTYDEYVNELNGDFFREHINEMLKKKIDLPTNYSGIEIL